LYHTNQTIRLAIIPKPVINKALELSIFMNAPFELEPPIELEDGFEPELVEVAFVVFANLAPTANAFA